MDELRLQIYYQRDKGEKRGKRFYLLYLAKEFDLEDGPVTNSHDDNRFYYLFKGPNRVQDIKIHYKVDFEITWMYDLHESKPVKVFPKPPTQPKPSITAPAQPQQLAQPLTRPQEP